jgi:hypothetical protein
MNNEEIHKWLVRYSISLHSLRKEIQSEEELNYFDNLVHAFLETCPNWWSNGSDTDLQATSSPDLFFKAITAKDYPHLTYRAVEEMERMRNFNL